MRTVPWGTAELQTEISSPGSNERKGFTPAFAPSFIFLCLHRARVCNGGKEDTPSLCRIYPSRPKKQLFLKATLMSSDCVHTACPLRAPWTKHGQRKLSSREESQFNYKLSYPTVGKNYLKMAPSVHLLKKQVRRQSPEGPWPGL